jgi:hypothetical protein
VADAVDFFGHSRSKGQSSEQDLKSYEIPKSKGTKKSKVSEVSEGDEDGNKKRNRKRKRSIFFLFLFF